jgi:hypothetical protein
MKYDLLRREIRIEHKGNKTYAWVTEEVEKFSRRFLAQHSEVDFNALMGISPGSLVERPTIVVARNFRCYNETLGFQLLCQFVE